MYFERQRSGIQSGLHAANNAIGTEVLVAADLNKAADEIVHETAVRAQEAQRDPEDAAALQRRMRTLLVGPGVGQWSADCVIRALALRGYYAHRRAAADLTFEGNWLLFGDKFRGGRPYAHAVALRGALLLDTESSAPKLLLGSQLPTSFRPWAAYIVDKLPPTDEPNDLTSDD
jgi:hypothetical protein